MSLPLPATHDLPTCNYGVAASWVIAMERFFDKNGLTTRGQHPDVVVRVYGLAVKVLIFNPSRWEAETGRSL